MRYLVTGASGSLGTAVVKRLRADGHQVRVLVRRHPDPPQEGLEYAHGDLGDPAAIDAAVRGVEIVIHCGAAMKGGWAEHEVAVQLVHISSLSVVDWAGSSDAAPVDETVKLEPRAEERGAYTRAKLEAEQLVSAAARAGLPVVILRPGQIFGGGIRLITGAVARNVGGSWLVLGDGKLELPLVYIDDVVDAVMLSIERKVTSGEIIQIVDPAALTQDDVLALAGGAKRILRVPRALVFAAGRLGELPLRLIGKPSPISVYRLRSALARIHYHSDRARDVLGWVPRVGVRAGIKYMSMEKAS
jgi:nucleoside-diphosphate-sugar epimerase